MAVLYMGPAAAVSLIAFLRAHRKGQLSNKIESEDTHPADVLRGLLVAHAVSFLNISDSVKLNWANYLFQEVKKDYYSSGWEFANTCARQVAYTVMHTPIINGQSLEEIKCWDSEDENLVNYYLDVRNVQDELIHYKAPHIIASANLRLLEKMKLQDSNDRQINDIFNQMINNLYEEGQLQKRNRNCLDCPLSQRNVLQVCPAPQTRVEEPKEKIKMDPVKVAAIGLGG
ncbi:hypothetical protein [Candidatus Protochlamydia sp. R18]|uniref:hypothetical protein n=1 Tax=Candidatus Protochlamydia sp. R18 TaxID=1353977 RepID=UPI0005A98AA6|nr:hypothetical protein [Candidatus Protochlamydia sp. R18]